MYASPPGYNYLMAQVNAAQRAANAINESFDSISGKRTCRALPGDGQAPRFFVDIYLLREVIVPRQHRDLAAALGKHGLDGGAPEDWTSGQIVAPSGADAGLSQQHGYNYLMAQVNAAQRHPPQTLRPAPKTPAVCWAVPPF